MLAWQKQQCVIQFKTLTNDHVRVYSIYIDYFIKVDSVKNNGEDAFNGVCILYSVRLLLVKSCSSIPLQIKKSFFLNLDFIGQILFTPDPDFIVYFMII